MALSGNLESFALPDVLQLLGSTGKSGLLTLGGDRGMGQVWLDEGKIVSARSDGAPKATIEGVVYELLRFESGSFEFEPDAIAEDPALEPVHVDDALEAAHELMEEWRAVEAVIPSLDTRVRLAGTIEDDAVVSAPDWAVVARIGFGSTPRDLSIALDVEDLEICRRLCDLVTRDLVVIDESDPMLNELEARRSGPEFAPPAFAARFLDGSSDTEDPPTPEVPVDEPPVEEVAVAAQPVIQDVAWTVAAPEPPAEDISPAEFLSELGSLSPKAAAAIEALEAQGADNDGDDEGSQSDFLSSLIPAEPPATQVADDLEVVVTEQEADVEPEMTVDEPVDEPVEEAPEPVAEDEVAEPAANLLNRFLSTRQ